MNNYMGILVRELNMYYQRADEAGKTIVQCATLAAGAAAIGGVFPFLEIPALIVSCVGAVWGMYIQICKILQIDLSENLLRILASAALTNIATNLVVVFSVEILACFIPVIASASGAMITFASVYLAGQMFMSMLLSFAKEGKTGADLGSLSPEDLQSVLEDQTPNKSDVKHAKQAYQETRQPGM